MIESLRAILKRDLAALRRELAAYETEADLWKTPPGATNSAGNLALHVAGNLRHFIGATLGGSGYVRNREAEFDDRDVPRDRLLATLESAAAEVDAALAVLTAERLQAPFPGGVGGTAVRTDDLLLHLSGHLAYHLGQIDYHRRLVTGTPGAIGAVAIPDLATAERP